MKCLPLLHIYLLDKRRESSNGTECNSLIRTSIISGHGNTDISSRLYIVSLVNQSQKENKYKAERVKD